MAPGPVVAAVLASIDCDRLSGFDRVVVLQARARQLATKPTHPQHLHLDQPPRPHKHHPIPTPIAGLSRQASLLPTSLGVVNLKCCPEMLGLAFDHLSSVAVLPRCLDIDIWGHMHAQALDDSRSVDMAGGESGHACPFVTRRPHSSSESLSSSPSKPTPRLASHCAGSSGSWSPDSGTSPSPRKPRLATVVAPGSDG